MAVTITCRCGKSSEYYRYLNLSDFPDGLKKECCETLPVETGAADVLFPNLPAAEVDALVKEVVEVVEEEPKPFRKYKRGGK